MGIFKKAIHSKSDVFVKFESAINLEIRGQIKKKDYFYLGHKDHILALSSKSGSEPCNFRLYYHAVQCAHVKTSYKLKDEKSVKSHFVKTKHIKFKIRWIIRLLSVFLRGFDVKPSI